MNLYYVIYAIGDQKKTILKKPNPLSFIGFWALLFFGFFLFERAVGKLIGWFSSSAKLLFTFVSTLDHLKICKFITY